ncbi:MAG: B-box zinc finger protein [Promethearchaeota archaeon]
MSENNTQLCRFCQRTKNLTYYCENCGSSCCSDCLHEEKIGYYICQECDSRNIEILDSGDRKICKECGSDNVNKVSQHIKSCPKCNSNHILNIYEKKEELEQKFLEMIRNTRKFADPFIELRNKLSFLRENLKKARDPPIKCYHFPKMEQELIILFKMFNEVVNTLLDKINIHFHHFSLNQDYFFDIYVQPNSSIRVIEKILQNLIRSYESIQEYINKNIELIKEIVKEKQTNLQFIEQINNYFLTYKNVLKLATNEKPVYAIKAKYDNGYNPQGVVRKTKGILFVTNFDLSFVHLFGVFKKKKDLIIKTPIDDLTDIQVKGKIRKRVYLEFTYGKYEFLLPPRTHSKVVEYIVLAKTFDENTKHNHEAAEKLQSIDLDLNNLVNFIEEAINTFFSLKVKYNQKFNNLSIQESEYGSQPFAQTYNEQINNLQFGNIQNQQKNHYVPLPSFPQNSPFDNQPFYPNNPGMPTSTNFERNLDRDDRNYLFRRVGRVQADSPQSPSPRRSFNNEWFHKAGLNRQSTVEDVPFIDPTYGNYNKYHLSDYFVPNPRFTQESKRMRELKKERYSLNMTLKKLDEKFDHNLISEEDYFRLYTNIQKRISAVDENLGSLKNDVYENL